MYDFIRFEIATNVCPDLDKRFPAEYPRYKSGDMACWTDCGCHWFISVPVAEEYQLREWFLDTGIQVTAYDYTKRRTVEAADQKEWIVEYLTKKHDELIKFLADTEFHVDMGLYEPFSSGARFQLIYVDNDDIENLYRTHTRPIDLYTEAVGLFEMAIKSVRDYPIIISDFNCGMSGFYAGGGKRVVLMNLSGQSQSTKEHRLFNISINNGWTCRLMAVRIYSIPEPEKTNEIPSVPNNKFIGRKVSTV